MLSLLKRVAGEIAVFLIVLNAAYFFLLLLSPLDIQTRITIISVILLGVSILVWRFR